VCRSIGCAGFSTKRQLRFVTLDVAESDPPTKALIPFARISKRTLNPIGGVLFSSHDALLGLASAAPKAARSWDSMALLGGILTSYSPRRSPKPWR